MLDFVIISVTMKHPNKGAVIKLCIKNCFVTILFLCYVTLARTFKFLFALLHEWLIWLSQLSLLSMIIPSIFSLLLFLIEKFPIWISAISFVITIKWNLIFFLVNNETKFFEVYLHHQVKHDFKKLQLNIICFQILITHEYSSYTVSE